MRLLAALIALAAAPASAQSPPAPRAPPEAFAVLWSIVPDQPVAPPGWFTQRNSITSARMEPARAFVIEGEVREEGGRVLVAAGSPMIWLAARTMAACATEPPPDRGLASVWWAGTNRYICLVDHDRDGRFEEYFNLRAGPYGILFGAGRMPRQRHPVAPVGYAERAPGSIGNPRRLYIRYETFAGLAGLMIFSVCFAEHGDALCLAPGAQLHADRLPGNFELLGARFWVDAKVENRVQVVQLSPVVRQPLVIRNY